MTSICTHPEHDHHDPDTPGEPLHCADAGLPIHWDETIQAYQHDDPTVDDCDAIHRDPDASPCRWADGW